MGGRGGGSGMSGSGSSGGSTSTYQSDYHPYRYGQVTRFEAGVIYRASKENKIKVLPETTKELYHQTEFDIRFAQSRYSGDHIYYDGLYRAVDNILVGKYKKAQKLLSEIEKDTIKRAGKKSRFYKYKKQYGYDEYE